MKRAVLYARVSTDEQADTGYSLPTQLEACRKYASGNSFEVVGEFTDDYTGTVPIETRPEGHKAYALLASGEADALIAYRIDRIVRPPEEGDEWDMPILIRGLAKVGKELHTCDRGRLGTSFADLLLAMLDAKSAGDERRKFIERSRRGKYGKAKTGKVVGGKTPYGYKHERDVNGKVTSLVPHEEEAQVVKLIYQWYVYGDGDGKPMAGLAIARKLSDMRIKSPGETRGATNRTRESGMWRHWQALTILESETYAGVWRFGVRIGNSKKTRPVDEQVEVSIPTIISRELWEAAQAQREHNKKMSKRNVRRDYLLRGMIKCACGSAMCGEFFSDHRYYRCSWGNSHHTKIEKRTCWQRSVRADLIEPLAWDFVMKLFSNEEELESLLRLAQQKQVDALAPKRYELETVELMLAECETEAAEYAAELVKTRGGKVREALEAKVQEFEERYAALSRRRDRLQAEITTGQRLNDESIRAALQFRENVFDGMQNPDYETKRQNLERLGVQIVVNGTQAKLSCIIPDYEKEVGIDSASYSLSQVNSYLVRLDYVINLEMLNGVAVGISTAVRFAV